MSSVKLDVFSKLSSRYAAACMSTTTRTPQTVKS